MFDIDIPGTQAKLAKVLALEAPSVSVMIGKGIIPSDGTLLAQVNAYCKHIRKKASGLYTDNGLTLTNERALLAREQAERIRMQNAIIKREYGPIAAVETTIADVMVRAANQLDAIPGKLKLANDKLTAEDLNQIARIIAEVRNQIADLEIDWTGEGLTDVED